MFKPLKETMRAIAQKHEIGYKEKENGALFNIHFNPDFAWHEASVMLRWKKNPNGKYNWWEDHIFDCKHHISGPGYPAYAISPQKPITREELTKKADELAKSLTTYKQYKFEIRA